jgi:hypothetical protein
MRVGGSGEAANAKGTKRENQKPFVFSFFENTTSGVKQTTTF